MKTAEEYANQQVESKEIYLAYDGINSEYESFDDLETAQKFIEESFLDTTEGYHPDLETCGIYKLVQKVGYDVIATRDGDEWSDGNNYGDSVDEIWQHKFIDLRDNYQPQAKEVDWFELEFEFMKFIGKNDNYSIPERVFEWFKQKLNK